MSMDKLTPKEELFCVEFMEDYNPIGAFIRAGFQCKKSLKKESEAMMSDSAIQKRIEQLYTKEVYESSQRDKKIFRELEAIAFSDPNSGEPVTTKEKLTALSELAKISGLSTDFNQGRKALMKYGFFLAPIGRGEGGRIKWELLSETNFNS